MSLPIPDDLRLGVIIPCYNEEAAIAKVVADIKLTLPTADIYVYDNNSSDETAARAAAAGAIVRTELAKGKGNVVRRAFADVEADVYVLIDGDDTYDVASIPPMINALLDGPFDHVLGVRYQREGTADAYRPGHSIGNRAFNALVGWLFRESIGDMLSGCRVFSRRFVKSFPAISHEFEIETELTIHYCSLRIPHTEMPVGFGERAIGTESKLRTFRDGFKILNLVLHLVRHERPVAFHGLLGLIVFFVALIIGIPVITEFFTTGLVLRLPSAVLASSLVILGAVTWVVGLLLEGVTRSRHENARLIYLSYPSVGRP